MLLLGVVLFLIGAGAMTYTALNAQDGNYRVMYSFCIMAIGIFTIILAVLT